MLPRDGVLELRQPALAVHPVPMQHGVQWVEKGFVVAQRLDVGLALLVEEDGVEHADGGAVEREGGCVEREDQLRLRRPLQFARRLRVLAQHEDAAREILPRGDTVEPTDGVLDLAVPLLQLEKLVDAVELDALVVDAARDDRPQPQLRPGDKARQPHAGDGCRVPVGVLGGRAEPPAAVRPNQFEARNVVAE